ncbi:MAG: HAMP domain-containing protein [Nitrospirae bacterium]|nr:HAMP domain-containing protein [Nitrospirota bacterium]
MFNTLKFRITITALLIISATMFITTWRDIAVTESKLLTEQKEKAVLLSDRIKHGIMVLMLENRWRELESMMEGLVRNSPELKELRIFQPETGIMVVSSDPKDIGKQIYKEDFERFRADKGNTPFLIKKGAHTYASTLNSIQNLPACHKCHGFEKRILGVLDIEVSVEAVYQAIQDFKRKHLMNAMVGTVLITGAFLFVLGILIGRPINAMISVIKKIEGGDVAVRMNINKKDELGQLAQSFNRMVESLEAAKKQIEEHHRQQVQKAAKLASLGELASGIAHEIKNPLAGISGAIQILAADFPPNDPKREITDEMQNQVKRLDQAVRDLLLYARPTPPQMSPNNINYILEKTLFFIRQVAAKGNTEIDTEFGKNLPETMLDAAQIQQVFLNLSINAIQAMPDGGNLKISTALKKPKELSGIVLSNDNNEEEWLEVKFEDTGVGIAPEDMKKIFNPFFTKKVKGTGIGLSISQRIVEEHGGIITVKSQVGKGSAFTVLLPVKKQITPQGAVK